MHLYKCVKICTVEMYEETDVSRAFASTTSWYVEEYTRVVAVLRVAGCCVLEISMGEVQNISVLKDKLEFNYPKSTIRQNPMQKNNEFSR